MSTDVSPIPIADIEQAMESIEREGAELSKAVETPVTMVAAGNPANALKEFVKVDQLKADIEFNPNNLDNAVAEHASKFVHYANLARLAQRQFERMKNAFSILESVLEKHYRDRLTNAAALIEDTKKPTEPQIRAAVITDPRWMAGANRLTDAQAIYSLARDAKKAFEERKDMIIQLSVDRRVERQGQLRILEAKGASDSKQSARAAAVAAAGGTS